MKFDILVSVHPDTAIQFIHCRMAAVIRAMRSNMDKNKAIKSGQTLKQILLLYRSNKSYVRVEFVSTGLSSSFVLNCVILLHYAI